jgi:hypothetical protein
MLRNALENPDPGAYVIKNEFEVNKLKKRGSSFGFRRGS